MGTVPANLAPPGLNHRQRRELAKQQRRQQRGRKPRQVMVNALEYVANQVSKLTDDERTRTLLPAMQGFKALREGVATHEHWAGVASAINVALAIEAQGVVKGLREHFEAAERALHAVYVRVCDHPGGDTWGRATALYFDEIAAIRQGIELHDFQLQQLSVKELHAAREQAIRDIRAAGGQLLQAPSQSCPAPRQERLL